MGPWISGMPWQWMTLSWKYLKNPMILFGTFLIGASTFISLSKVSGEQSMSTQLKLNLMGHPCKVSLMLYLNWCSLSLLWNLLSCITDLFFNTYLLELFTINISLKSWNLECNFLGAGIFHSGLWDWLLCEGNMWCFPRIWPKQSILNGRNIYATSLTLYIYSRFNVPLVIGLFRWMPMLFRSCRIGYFWPN